MATHSTNDGSMSTARVEQIVAALTQQYNLTYLLSSYVDKDYWLDEVRACFGMRNVENLTDFNYSRCFVYAITEGDLDIVVGDGQIKRYVQAHGNLHRVYVMISVLTPCVVCKCLEYFYDNNELRLKTIPCVDFSLPGKQSVEQALSKLCSRNKLFKIADEDLRRTISGISLELHGPNPSVFNLLFEDVYSDFPYE